MENISFENIKINNGFWKIKQDMVKESTVYSVYNRFCDTHRFDALRCRWKKEGKYEAHIYWDSDVAKWIEGVAYILIHNDIPELEKLCDDAIDNIVSNMDETGYFNSYFLTTRQDERWSDRNYHELYCAGHLIEAAIAYKHATGKDKFLKAMCRFADLIERLFKIEGTVPFTTPGHPELELALVKLYKETNDKRYLELSSFFIEKRGNCDNDQPLCADRYYPNYYMDEAPLRKSKTVTGHCVKAFYLLSGAIDVAKEYNDKELIDACKNCYESIVNRQMYITGGIGPTPIGEGFTVDYDLPNRTAYAETCAAISLMLFCNRMHSVIPDSRYADTVERTIYNGIISGVSMDGTSFFYENPLEIDPKFNNVNVSTVAKERYPITERVKVFECSCCPPNIVRIIPSIANTIYTASDDVLYINQYIDSEMNRDGMTVTQETSYPASGEVKITAEISQSQIALRIPYWCRNFTLNLPYEIKNGYAYIKIDRKTEINFNMDMPINVIGCNPKVHANEGRVAIMRGPVVYCAEGIDNNVDLHSVQIDTRANFKLSDNQFILPSIIANGYKRTDTESLYFVDKDEEERVEIKLIPYYAFANRGTSEMLVWLLKH